MLIESEEMRLKNEDYQEQDADQSIVKLKVDVRPQTANEEVLSLYGKDVIS